MHLTFLSKLGGLLAKGALFAAGLEPLLVPFAPQGGNIASRISDSLTAIASIIVNVEAILGAGGGAAKLEKATGLVASMIRSSELAAGHKIAKEDLFIQGSEKVTSGMADILNSFEPTVNTIGDPVIHSS